MKRLLFVLLLFMVVFSSCLPLIEPITMDDTPTTLNINKDIVLPPGTTVDGVDISTIAGAAHTQNTDTNMGVLAVKPLALDADKFIIRDSAAGDVFSTTTGAQVKTFLGTHTQNTDWTLKDSAGGANLIHNGYIVSDMRTDRWLLSDRNTFFGVDIADGAGVLSGTMNSAYGNECMYDITTGASNTAVGWRSQKGLTEGNFNTSIGDQTLVALTAGTGNTAVGVSTLASVKTSGYNTGVGADVLWNATSGYNTGMGAFAGAAIVDGDNNVYIGYDAGNDNVSGDNNVAVGNHAGHTNTGTGNVFLGYKAGEDSGAVDNKLYIDNSDDPTPLIYGDFATDTVTINDDLTVTDDLTVGGNTELQNQVSLTGSGLIWQQKTMPIQIARIIASGTPTRVERGIFQGFSLPVGGANEELFTCQCIPSNWNTGTNMTLYVGGWLDTANTGKKFQLRMAYNSWSDGDVVPATSTNVDVESDTGAAAQYQAFKIKFTIPAGSMARGDALGIRLSRIAATTDEIAGEFVVEGMGLVYQCDSLGSATD